MIFGGKEMRLTVYGKKKKSSGNKIYFEISSVQLPGKM